VTACFLILQSIGYPFPNLISPTGLLLSQSLITFGWIYTGAVVIWVFLVLIENHLQEIEKKKEGIQNLICVITHDISNSLMVVTGRSNSLRNTLIEDAQLNSIRKISNAAKNINDIVNNVKNLYANELGKTQLLLTEVNLIDILGLLNDNFSDILETKKIKLSIQYENEQCLIISNADLLLHQILGNLLSNSIKFSMEESEISIKVKKNKSSVSIVIKDSGIGMPKDLVGKIFEISANTSRSGTAGERGTGFGLPIVKSYVEMLQGNIRVESISKDESSNHGTTFYLEF
jgi:signal transduction histidine kinase